MGVLRVTHDADQKPDFAQPTGEQLGGVRIVFDDQHAGPTDSVHS